MSMTSFLTTVAGCSYTPGTLVDCRPRTRMHFPDLASDRDLGRTNHTRHRNTILSKWEHPGICAASQESGCRSFEFTLPSRKCFSLCSLQGCCTWQCLSRMFFHPHY